MNIPNVQILDFSDLAGILASWGLVSFALMWMRKAFLDNWLKGLPSDQQNQVLRGVLFLLTFAGILALALVVAHHPFDWQTVASAAVAAGIGSFLNHLGYNYVQKKPAAVASLSAVQAAPLVLPMERYGVPDAKVEPTSIPAVAPASAP